MATIKEQTERTERLQINLSNKVDSIASEIKRSGGSSISKLSEVPREIRNLINSRKKWAEGGYTSSVGVSITGASSGYGATVVCIDLSNLSFKPRIIITELEGTTFSGQYISIQDVKQNYCYLTYQANGRAIYTFNLFYEPFFSYKWLFGNKAPTKYEEGTPIEEVFNNGNRVTKDFLVEKNFYPVYFKAGTSNFESNIKIRNWIAFE
jgi:hypothetical protein